MTDYAFLDENGKVKTILYFEEEVPNSILQKAHDQQGTVEAILVTEETGHPHINGDVLDGKFRDPEPEGNLGWNSLLWTWSMPAQPMPVIPPEEE